MRPYTIVTYNTPTVMTKDSYEVGEQMTYVVDYCKNYSIPATVYRSLVDGVVYNLNSTIANIATGCHKTIMSAGKVPDVANGTYHLHLKLVFTPNHFRDVVYEYDTNSFEIINNKE